MEIAFAALVEFVFGIIVSILVASSFLTSEDDDTEKRGVWTNRARAYRLHRIDPADTAGDRE